MIRTGMAAVIAAFVVVPLLISSADAAASMSRICAWRRRRGAKGSDAEVDLDAVHTVTRLSVA
jgi:hypothetical protein